MAEPTISSIFPGATQDSSFVTIPKSALLTLSPTDENRADSIAAAILITLKNFYTEERRTNDPLVSIVAELDRPSVDINFETGINYLNRPIVFNLYSDLALPEFDADSY